METIIEIVNSNKNPGNPEKNLFSFLLEFPRETQIVNTK
jgi:hypothetical protein